MKKIYVNILTSVKVECKRSESFEVKFGVHLELVLSPLLFSIVMDVVVEDN